MRRRRESRLLSAHMAPPPARDIVIFIHSFLHSFFFNLFSPFFFIWKHFLFFFFGNFGRPMTLPTFSSCFFSCFNLRCYLVLLGFFTYRLRFVGSVVVVVQASIDLYLVFFFYPVIQINAQPTNGFLPVSLFFFSLFIRR